MTTPGAGAIDHETVRELLPEYVFGTLSPEMSARISEHLAACAECAADARALMPAAQALARAVPQVDPPAALRGRVLSAATGRGSGRVAATAPPERSIVARASGWPAWLAAAASLLVAAGVGNYAVRLRARADAMDAQLRETAARSDENARALIDVTRRAADAQNSIAVLTAPDVARVALAGQPAAPNASAHAFFSRTRGVVFSASNLPALPAARTYQLWAIAGNAPVSVGLLRPDASGRADAVLPAPPLPGPASVLAVTIEPAGGVPAPTGDKFLVGTVSGS